MARARSRTVEQEKGRTCGNCGWGIWDRSHINIDLDGNPICLVCKWEENRKRIRTEEACKHWKQRDEK